MKTLVAKISGNEIRQSVNDTVRILALLQTYWIPGLEILRLERKKGQAED